MIKQMINNQSDEQRRKNKMESPTVHLGGKYSMRLVFAIPLE